MYVCTYIGDWRSDQYRWRQTGHKPLPTSDTKIYKYYFDILTSTGKSNEFQKIAFHLPNEDHQYLIQYIGNHQLAIDYPHGNV